VPGALITLSRTAEPHIFTLTYEEQTETQDRLLVLDEKKNKFAFANVSYYSAVDEDMLVNQQQYGRLRNLKSLPMGECFVMSAARLFHIKTPMLRWPERIPEYKVTRRPTRMPPDEFELNFESRYREFLLAAEEEGRSIGERERAARVEEPGA